MKRCRFALVLFGLSLMSSASAQQASICESALALINEDLRAIAEDIYESRGDNSAPRATLRELRRIAAIQKAQLNIALMRDAKCAMPSIPYDERAFHKFILQKCGSPEPKLGEPYTPEEGLRISDRFRGCVASTLTSDVRVFK